MKSDPQRTFAALSLLVADLVKTMDCNKTMDEDEIIFAVQTLIDDYPVMKLEEWKHVCDNIKRGKYGKLYERLKLPELVQAFQTHEEKRAELMENMHRQNQNQRCAHGPFPRCCFALAVYVVTASTGGSSEAAADRVDSAR